MVWQPGETGNRSAKGEVQYLNISDNPLTEPLPAAVCTFIRGVKTVVAQGIDMNVVCPE